MSEPKISKNSAKKKVNWPNKVFQLIPNKKTTIGKQVRANSANRPPPLANQDKYTNRVSSNDPKKTSTIITGPGQINSKFNNFMQPEQPKIEKPPKPRSQEDYLMETKLKLPDANPQKNASQIYE
jgi:hypothetical protein